MLSISVVWAASSVKIAWAISLEKPPDVPMFVSVSIGAVAVSYARLIMRLSSIGVMPPAASMCHENGHRNVMYGSASESTVSLMLG